MYPSRWYASISSSVTWYPSADRRSSPFPTHSSTVSAVNSDLARATIPRRGVLAALLGRPKQAAAAARDDRDARSDTRRMDANMLLVISRCGLADAAYCQQRFVRLANAVSNPNESQNLENAVCANLAMATTHAVWLKCGVNHRHLQARGVPQPGIQDLASSWLLWQGDAASP